MMTPEARLLELSSLTGTHSAWDHFNSITVNVGIGSNVYEVIYIPNEEEEIQYKKIAVESVEFITKKVIEINYLARKTEVNLIPSKQIEIEFIPTEQIDISYEQDS